MKTKTISFLIILTLSSSCTILDKNISLYAPTLDIQDESKISKIKEGEYIQDKICNHMYFIFPTTNKNQFDAFEEVVAKNKPFNALVNARVKSSFFIFPLIYSEVCHEVYGKLVELNVESKP